MGHVKARYHQSDLAYWIPAEGIEKNVIVHEIRRYLGWDAKFREGKNDSGHFGYLINAYRPPTSAMIRSLKETSATRQLNSGSARLLPRPATLNHLADNLDSSGLRVLMERDRKRREMKWEADQPPMPASTAARRTHSDSCETYQTLLPMSANLRTRLGSVCCEGPYSGHTIDAFLDSGATDNVISRKLYTILEAMEAVELEDVDVEISEIGSPIGEVIEVIGITKVNIRWFDHEGENVRKKIKFKVIPGLYPDMIFKPTTFQELGMLLAADTWPRDDPRKGFLMFNTPWLSSKTKEQNRKEHEIKKAANAARAAQEREDRKNERSGIVPANTATSSPQNNRPRRP